MPKKNFNQVTIDRNTIPEERPARQKPCINNGEGLQTYCFEFGDEKDYAVFFEGVLTKDDIRSILKVLHGHLYKDCPEAIRSYLDRHHLDYSCFRTKIFSLKHDEIMKRAEKLLSSDTCDEIDSHIVSADNYYAVMDHQKQIKGGGREGCYYTVQRTTGHANCSYRMIGQTFSIDKYNDNFHGYFAIRTGQSGRQIRDLDALSGEPVLPDFGCVDMIAILMDIDGLATAEQVIKTALR